MHVRSIALRNFMKHADLRLDIPRTGILLVTGINGAGKSGATAEAAAYALHGKTLRGTQPWSGAEGSATLVADTVEVTVKKKGSGTPKVTWCTPGSQPVEYGTPTKSRVALASHIGDFDTWKRVSVFSAADATYFSLATDSDRKVFIERLLGYDRFDDGLKACRVDMKQAESALSTAKMASQSGEERVRGLQARLSDAKEAAPVMPPPAAKNLNGAAMEIQALQRQQLALTEQRAALGQAVAEAKAALRNAEREHERLANGQCPTCGAEICQDRLLQLSSGVGAAKVVVHSTEQAAKLEGQRLSAEIENLNGDVEVLRNHIASARAAQTAWDAAHKESERLQKKRADLGVELEAAVAHVAKWQADTAVLQADVDELKCVESILGLKGVRAHLLGKALAALTALSNVKLATLLPGVSICLREEDNKLVMNIRGMPHEEDYHGCSSGERRRIDLSVLFALGALDAVSRGAEEGTVFLDEVADTLDGSGIEAVAELLITMAESRAVVLITHNKDLISAIKPRAAGHIHME